jgi:hypothetical protein
MVSCDVWGVVAKVRFFHLRPFSNINNKYQGLVKWYHVTFGALWRKFDSFIPDQF